MVLPQRATADATLDAPMTVATAASFGPILPRLAEAAARYQRLREIEQAHLALMGRHNLLTEWTAEVRDVVLEARARIQEACQAREAFRRDVREFVLGLRAAREGLPSVLRRTRELVQLLERTGALPADDGWVEAEVLEWAIEEFDSAA